jgi:hypothetical protein
VGECLGTFGVAYPGHLVPEFWVRRDDAERVQAVLAGANLFGAILARASLRGDDLSGAVLRWADLEGADLRGRPARGFSACSRPAWDRFGGGRPDGN